MFRSICSSKVIGLSFAVAGLVLLFGTAPAAAQSAAPALPALMAAPAPSVPAPAACKMDLAALQKGETCAATAPDESQPAEWLASDAKVRRGYCHCGCVNVRVCRTSADCGGASCDQFISCC
jgi:hypothetical protein